MNVPARLSFACFSCGYPSTGAFVQCPRCKKVNVALSGQLGVPEGTVPGVWEPKKLVQIKKDRVKRVRLQDPALDTLFGGGPVKSCSYLFSGPPGSGKSSWALQACQFFEAPLYITGEETVGAIKLRAERFGIAIPHADVVETRDMEIVAKHISDQYDGVIYDSAHRFRTDDTRAAVGTALQVASVIALCSDMARKLGHVAFVVGHVNKDGEQSGMVANEHDVDATITLHKRGKKRRMIMTKNRHGECPIVVECEMTAKGLDGFTLVEDEREGVL